MLNIDKTAYTSKLIKKSPEMKIIFACTTLILSLWADSIIFSTIVFFIMSFMTLNKGGVPFGFYAQMLLVPIFFLTTGLITIALDLSMIKEIYFFSIPLGDWFFGISKKGGMIAFVLFFKAMGAVSCLYFLSFTTPMVSLFGALRRWHVPSLFVELAELIYRFLFLLLDTAEHIYTAQNTRLGYHGIRNSFHSLGLLLASLFIRTFKRSEDIYNGLESRGYDGELSFLEEEYEKPKKDISLLVIFEFSMLLLSVSIHYLKGVSGWIL